MALALVATESGCTSAPGVAPVDQYSGTYVLAEVDGIASEAVVDVQPERLGWYVTDQVTCADGLAQITYILDPAYLTLSADRSLRLMVRHLHVCYRRDQSPRVSETPVSLTGTWAETAAGPRISIGRQGFGSTMAAASLQEGRAATLRFRVPGPHGDERWTHALRFVADRSPRPLEAVGR
ncbi:MAG TPA: hypothetical protein VFJ45_07850 [bacterium]|nr:hypothetical protein [bacterium]